MCIECKQILRLHHPIWTIHRIVYPSIKYVYHESFVTSMNRQIGWLFSDTEPANEVNYYR
jgi:hypothetical protein